jgi:hypothetical protein
MQAPLPHAVADRKINSQNNTISTLIVAIAILRHHMRANAGRSKTSAINNISALINCSAKKGLAIQRISYIF